MSESEKNASTSTEFVFAEGMNEPVEVPTESVRAEGMNEPSDESISPELAQKLAQRLTNITNVDLAKRPFTPRSYSQWSKLPYIKEAIHFKEVAALANSMGRQVDIDTDGLYVKDETVPAQARCQGYKGILPENDPCPYNEKVFGFKSPIVDIAKDGTASFRLYRNGNRMHRGPARVVDNPDGTKEVVLNGSRCKSAINEGIRLKNREAKSDADRAPLPRWQSNEEAAAFAARHNDWVAGEAKKKADKKAEEDARIRRIANTFQPTTPRGKSRKEMSAKRREE